MSWIETIPYPDVFFDAGPGFVNSEAWMVKKKWPNVEIVGVEADLRRYSAIRNKYPGTLIHCAVGDQNRKCVMQRVKSGASVNFPRPNQVDASNQFKIGMRTLDDLADEFFPKGQIFVWADIEGAELMLLRGAKGLISAGRITGFYLEVWRDSQCKGWANRSEIDEFLSSRGYYEHQVVVMGKHHGDVVFLRRTK